MRLIATFRRVKHPRYPYLATYADRDESGRPVRRKAYFLTRKAAVTFVAKKKVELLNHGARHAGVSDDERAALIRYRTWAAGQGDAPVLLDLINLAIKSHETVHIDCTVQEMVNRRLDQAKREGLSDRHRSDLDARLTKFAAIFGTRQAASVTSVEIEDWLHGLKCAPQTFTNYRRVVGSAFALQVKRGVLPANPIVAVGVRKIVRQAPAILTPAQLEKLLRAAAPDLRALMVLQAFCGLRRAESERLTWDLIRLNDETPIVEVPSAVTKTNRRRTIVMPPNAVLWLKPLKKSATDSLGITDTRYRQGLVEAATSAGVTWQENLLRHSFGSYRFAVLQDAAKVAAAMGNSPTVVLTHYANLVRPDEAAAYWAIVPKNPPSRDSSN